MTASIIQRAALARRVDALFRAMATDFLLREQFVTNPAQILSEFVHGKAPSPERAAVENQLVYAIMAHPRLLAWLRDYVRDHHHHPPSLDRAVGEFSRAVVHHGARHVVIALARSSVEREPIDFEEAWMVFFGIRAILEEGTERGGTIMGGTSGGGTIMGGTDQGNQGTIMGQGTDQGGQGTIMGGGTIMGDRGTGTGTEAAVRGTGILGSPYAHVTLEALAHYAQQLLAAGALDAVYER